MDVAVARLRELSGAVAATRFAATAREVAREMAQEMANIQERRQAVGSGRGQMQEAQEGGLGAGQ